RALAAGGWCGGPWTSPPASPLWLAHADGSTARRCRADAIPAAATLVLAINYESSRDSSESASSTCSTRRRNRAMRSEWASTTSRPHQPPSETNRKEFEPAAKPGSHDKRLCHDHPSPPQARRRTSSCADGVCYPRTSDLDSSLVSSSSGSGGAPPARLALFSGGASATGHSDKGPSPVRGASSAAQCHSSGAGDATTQCSGGGGDTGYGETSSSEEQESSWSRSTESSAAPSSSSSPSADTASGALASREDTEQESEPGTSEQVTSTEEQQSYSLDTEDVSQMTAASEVPADDDAKLAVEDQTEGEAQAMQPAEPSLPPTPQFLRPTIEIDRSDILHTAKPEIDEGDFGVGPSYTKMTEAEFVARLSIHEAARTGDLHVIKLLLKSDPKRMETVDERGWTPIHLAAANGHAEIVRYLAVEGADVAALDPTSYTAMHLAAMNGHNACLEVLLKMGADVDNITADGFTPLHLAALK
ncbi:hypothetical protein MTO96_036244, partial [Rhipicephalus appendiculatus]